MSSVEFLREFVTERLTAAAEEILGVFVKTMVEYQEEIERQRRLLDVVWKPEIKLHRIELQQQSVCKEEEVLTDQQLCKQERNSSLDREEPESPQIKEEQEEVCSSQEGEQRGLKQETNTFLQTPTTTYCNNDVDNSPKSEVIEKEIGCQRRLRDIVWKPKIKLDKLELPHQHGCKKEEVLTDHKRNSSMDQEDPEPPQIKEEQEELYTSRGGEQLVLNQETDTFMLIPPYEESDPSEPAPSSDQEGSKHVDSGSTRNAESKPKKTYRSNNADNSPMSETHCDTQTGKRSFKCDTCSNVYQYKYKLNLHLRIHTGEKPYACRTCGKRFRKTLELKKHIELHKGQNSYLCKTCGKGFEEISKFNRHKKNHTAERPYSCDTCGKRFSQLSGLKAHTRVHTDERPHVCNTCGKKFRELSKLKKHQRIHTGEKPYLCNTCGKRFREQSGLIRHERVHTGERPYPCDTCGKKFKQAAALKTHLQIHTGVKPYRCKACGKRFYRMTHLRGHMKIHVD